MSKIGFRFSPDILRRLGEELNPSPARGIIELVRNSYDADARRCQIDLSETDQAGGTIHIADDGDGMNLEDIEGGWFVLGRSKKTREATRLGRIPVGDKGLGRLAALRLGTSVEVTTRHISDPSTQYSFTIEWKSYDNVDVMDSVTFEVYEEQSAGDASSGTEILISDLTSGLGRREVKKLARELVLLADPFELDPKGFKPKLTSPAFRDLQKMVRQRYFDNSEFILKARLLDDGYAEAVVTDFKGQALFVAEHSDLRPKEPLIPYRCPPSEFDLWVYILQSDRFVSRTATLGGVKEWLDVFGGVHVYQNSIRVPPYGDSGVDWLEMNVLRARSPEVTPSTNTSIGLVTIRDVNDVFVQKTDRSGFIENEAFRDLRQFGQDVLRWMQRQRLADRERRRGEERQRAKRAARKARDDVQEAIKEAPPRARKEITRAFATYDQKKEREARSLRKEVQLYRTLSTAGIASAVFAHESANNPVKVIKQSTRTIRRRARQLLSGAKYAAELESPIERVLRSADALTVLSSVTLSLLAHEKRRATRVDLYSVIERVLEIFDAFLTARQVTVDWSCEEGQPYLRGNEAAFEAILTNLLSNSLQAFESSQKRSRKIEIETIIEDGPTLELRFRDSGPGIEGISKNDIWLPGETTRENGTGLGLAIVRDTVRDLGGSVDAKERCELGGAEIILSMPLIGA